MKSLRFYVPATRADDPAVKPALARVQAGGATLYWAAGTWPDGTETLMERVVVVEVLDCDTQRLEAVDKLAAALLDAGEETVLIARQETISSFIIREDRVQAVAQL